MAEHAAMVRSWRVGRYTVTATIPQTRKGAVVTTVMEWAPERPRGLTKKELQQYRAGRNKAYGELFKELGVKGMIVEY